MTTQSTDYLAPVWSHLTTWQPVRGQGAYLYDADGNAYLDFTCGIGVTNTGHNHPDVVRAIKEQAEQLIFAQMNIVMSPQFVALAQALNTITPPHIDRFFFSNSGAEATEGAVKLARHATGKTNIIVFQGSFHGRTAQTMAMTTSKTVYRYKYQPLPGGIFVAPFPAAYYYGMTEDEAIDFAMKQLTYLIKGQTAPEETAAIIIEPVLGEGGYIPAPDRFLRELRTFATKHNILLVLDEVQSGFGRTGKMFAFEHADIEPDIIIMAKGLGSGMPISAVASSADLMTKWSPGSHGGTYGGGNAIVGAAARATVEVMQRENLPANAAHMGERLMTSLRDIQAEFPIIGDVRGRGLMVATEFTHPDGSPAPDVTAKVIQGVLERNMLMLSCGTFSNVIRWIPPLIVTEAEIDKGLSIFVDALKSALK